MSDLLEVALADLRTRTPPHLREAVVATMRRHVKDGRATISQGESGEFYWKITGAGRQFLNDGK